MTHLGGEVDNPIKLTQNNLLTWIWNGGDEALVVNLQSRKSTISSKKTVRIQWNFLELFSDNLLTVAPKI